MWNPAPEKAGERGQKPCRRSPVWSVPDVFRKSPFLVLFSPCRPGENGVRDGPVAQDRSERSDVMMNLNVHAREERNGGAAGDAGMGGDGDAAVPRAARCDGYASEKGRPGTDETPCPRVRRGTETLKEGLARMQVGGVIMDVTNAEQARIAESAGAVAVMVLDRVPSELRKAGGVARMAAPERILEIREAVSIPVMAKARIGHFVEAQILEALGVDCIDESEVLTPADEEVHIDKHAFSVPFVCGCRNLGEALRRIAEGAAMIRTKGEAGTGNVVEAVRHVRAVARDLRRVLAADGEELVSLARELGVPVAQLLRCRETGRLPVVQFAAGGIATPADAALMMRLGCDGVFVGSGIFISSDPRRRAEAIVEAVAHYDDPSVLARVSSGIGEAMAGTDVRRLAPEERLQERGV